MGCGMTVNVYDEYEPKYRFLLERAEAEVTQAKLDKEQLQKKNKIPPLETISAIASILGSLYALLNFENFIIVWYFSTFLVLLLVILRNQMFKKNRTKSRAIPSQKDLQDLGEQLKKIEEDEKSKILFYSVSTMIFANMRLLIMPYSLLFLVNVIISAYILCSACGENLTSVSWYVLVASLTYFVLFGLIWFYEGFIPRMAKSLLKMHQILDINKLEKRKIVIILLLVIFLLVLFGGLTVLMPILASKSILDLYIGVFLSYPLQVVLTILGQLVIVLYLQGMFSRIYVLKWLDKKVYRLKNSVIVPIEAQLSHDDLLKTKDELGVSNMYKSIRKRFLKSMILTVSDYNFYGYFTRHLLIINFNTIQSEDDFDVLVDHMNSEYPSLS